MQLGRSGAGSSPGSERAARSSYSRRMFASAPASTRSALIARPMPSPTLRGSSETIMFVRFTDFGTHTSTVPSCSASTIASATSVGSRLLTPRTSPRSGAELGVDDRRHHVADVDVRAHQPQLAADRLGQADDRVLGRRVRRAAGRAELARLRGDVDDVPAVARDHALQRELAAEDHAVEVDVDHPSARSGRPRR